MLQEVVNSGTAAGVRGMGFYAPAAGKTGTSRDGWFAGFTSELLVVVWVGFDDNRELNLEGARSALPIWTYFMRKSAERSRYAPHELASRPNGVVQVEIDPETGKLAGPSCSLHSWAYFLQGQEPTEECHGHEIDPLTGEPVSELLREAIPAVYVKH
jgi:penicillin-binding protein 1B